MIYSVIENGKRIYGVEAKSYQEACERVIEVKGINIIEDKKDN